MKMNDEGVKATAESTTALSAEIRGLIHDYGCSGPHGRRLQGAAPFWFREQRAANLDLRCMFAASDEERTSPRWMENAQCELTRLWRLAFEV
jgi:hypothetical protein